jgi:hypothetical protein
MPQKIKVRPRHFVSAEAIELSRQVAQIWHDFME